ncbi:MAG: aminotransferase class I/II-fold pyridoxal phosphate-dependent enzyme [Planctomycetia bacterium]|nr:aminotransferase class I/II-fold pyridoxal phosphate-dependent enzyme [Planctomycetia bacterium]
MKNIQSKKLDTQVAHAGTNPDKTYGAVAPPIYQTSTFKFNSAEQGAKRFLGEEPGFIYTRLGNPTTAALQEAVAILEKGTDALATASGMAAVTTIYTTFLEAGAHMIASEAIYGPSRVVMEKEFSRFGVKFDFVDTSDIENVKRVIRPNTKLIFIETPANPTIKLTDIKACADIAHSYGAVLAVDNTFMSPILQNPFDFGADIVMHSMTKYINGHTDVVSGILVFNNKDLLMRTRKVLLNLGGTIDPYQAWLVLRGLRTLSLRVRKAQENAQIIAEFLENHPKVEWVRYPGLLSHPHHELAKKQMHGFGSMISFEVQGGVEGGRTIMNNVELAILAVSLGGYETLIQHPASMTHSAMNKQDKIDAGITDGLVRISIGCEDVQDIQDDLDNCLRKI